MFVVRARYVQPDGVGWLDKNGSVTSNVRNAQRYDTEDEAWTHAAAAEILGCDEKGDWAWVEAIDIAK